jgi:Icc-related predicted phosphoesterase
MRIICLSDTHGMTTDQLIIPEGDVLVHAGDFCGHGREQEFAAFNRFLGEQPHKHKLFIAGNHDIPAERCGRKWVHQRVPNGIYLQDNAVDIEGLRFYGSPWQPEFFNWAFNLPRGRALARKWGLIPKDTDVLITHGPPWGMLDVVGGEHVGCVDLMRSVLSIKPKAHLFGHIHEGYGQAEKEGIIFVNASTCNGRYDPVNPPIVIDL